MYPQIYNLFSLLMTATYSHLVPLLKMFLTLYRMK